MPLPSFFGGCYWVQPRYVSVTYLCYVIVTYMCYVAVTYSVGEAPFRREASLLLSLLKEAKGG